MTHTKTLQHNYAPLDGITFRDAAEVDTHPGLQKADRSVTTICLHQTVINQWQLFSHRVFVRAQPLTKIVVLPDTVIGDVERTTCKNRNIQGAQYKAEQFIASLYGPGRCISIDFRNAAVLNVSTHEPIEPGNLGEHCRNCFRPELGIVVPQINTDLSAHVWLGLAIPLGERRS